MNSWLRLIIIFWIIPLVVYAAAATLTSSGNWSDSGNWSSGNIADDISEDVDWDNNIGTVTIQNGDDYTISNMDMKNGNTLTIDAGGNLDIGDNSNAYNLTTGNTAIVNVDGTLEIWGDLDVGNTLTLNVTGTLIIHGDVNLGNNGSLDISGDVTIDGDFTGGNGTDVNVDGNLDVGGTIDTGSGSELTGSGTVSSGDCTGDPDFCAGAPLPIELIYFSAKAQDNKVELKWATASEENFDYFSIERSLDGYDFREIAQVTGSGNTFQRANYSYEDHSPALGKSYYRLRSIDFDGYTEIFDYIIVDVEGTQYQANVYPNPVTSGMLNVQLNFDVEDGQVIIYNNMGFVVMTLTIDSWLNNLDISSLQSGNYLIKIITDKDFIVKRILVK